MGGYPKTIRVDNGSEFVSRDLDLWAYANGVTLDFSRPGKPTDNGFIEAFNSKLRAECLNAHWFMSLADAREKREDWPLSADCRAIACRAMTETTMRFGLTARSDTTSRSTCIFPMAHPARHRDNSREIPASGGPRLGSSAFEGQSAPVGGPLSGGSSTILFDHPNGARALFDGNRALDHAADNHRRTMGEALVEGPEGTIELAGDGSLWLRRFNEVTVECLLPADP